MMKSLLLSAFIFTVYTAAAQEAVTVSTQAVTTTPVKDTAKRDVRFFGSKQESTETTTTTTTTTVVRRKKKTPDNVAVNDTTAVKRDDAIPAIKEEGIKKQ